MKHNYIKHALSLKCILSFSIYGPKAGLTAFHVIDCLCFCVQGFICPQCMKSHNSAEELFKHYEVYHEPQEQPSHLGTARSERNPALVTSPPA